MNVNEHAIGNSPYKSFKNIINDKIYDKCNLHG